MGDGLLDCVLHLVPLLVLGARDVPLVLDLVPALGQDEGVLLAVAEVEEHAGNHLRHWKRQ